MQRYQCLVDTLHLFKRTTASQEAMIIPPPTLLRFFKKSLSIKHTEVGTHLRRLESWSWTTFQTTVHFMKLIARGRQGGSWPVTPVLFLVLYTEDTERGAPSVTSLTERRVCSSVTSRVGSQSYLVLLTRDIPTVHDHARPSQVLHGTHLLDGEYSTPITDGRPCRKMGMHDSFI